MAIGNGVVIRFLADTGQAVRNISKLERATGRSVGVMGRAEAVWAKAGPALAAVGAAAATTAIALGVKGVQAALDEEAALAKLSKTLQNLGMTEAQDEINATVESMMRQTGVADDQLRPAMEKLLLATKNVDTATSLLTTAMDLAVGAGVPLENAVAAVAKAAGGQYGALKRLVPQLDLTAAKTGGLKNVQKQLNAAYGGQAANAAETYTGQIQKMTTAFDELLEAFGGGVVGGDGGVNGQVGELSDLLYQAQPSAEAFGQAMNDAATGILTMANALYQAKDAIDGNPFFAAALDATTRLVTGPTAALGNLVQAVQAEQAVNPYELYRPMNTAQRYRDATRGADARSAAKQARTRQPP